MSAFRNLPTGCEFEGTVPYSIIPNGFPFCEVPPFYNEPVFVPRLPEIVIPDIAPPDVCRCIEFNVIHNIEETTRVDEPTLDFTIVARELGSGEETGIDCCEPIFDVALDIKLPVVVSFYDGLWAARCTGNGDQIYIKAGVYHIPGWGWYRYPESGDGTYKDCGAGNCLYLKVWPRTSTFSPFDATIVESSPDPDEEGGVFWARIMCNVGGSCTVRQDQYGVVLIPTTMFG